MCLFFLCLRLSEIIGTVTAVLLQSVTRLLSCWDSGAGEDGQLPRSGLENGLFLNSEQEL